MSTFFEESERKHLEAAIEDILSQFDKKVDERIILKDLISTANLLIQKRNIQYEQEWDFMDRKKLVSNSRIFNYNLFAPDNRDALEIMNTLAKSVRVSKLSSISLTDFYSVETSFILVSPNNSNVNISMSFLRHHDMLFS